MTASGYRGSISDDVDEIEWKASVLNNSWGGEATAEHNTNLRPLFAGVIMVLVLLGHALLSPPLTSAILALTNDEARYVTMLPQMIAAGPLVIGASPARGEPYTSAELKFLHDVEAQGIVSQVGDDSLVLGGWMVCRQLAQGKDAADIAEGIYAGSAAANPTGAGITHQQARTIVSPTNA